MAYLRDKLKDRLLASLDEVYINGTMEHRLPNNLNISFAYVEGESLLMGINDIAVSSGSACTSATLEPSYVLKALGAGDDLAHSSIRFGLGRFNTEEEVDYVAGESDRRGEEAARAFAAVRDAQRRNRFDQGPVDGALSRLRRKKLWHIQTKFWIITIIPATSARSTRAIPTSAPAWWARPNAAT